MMDLRDGSLFWNIATTWRTFSAASVGVLFLGPEAIVGAGEEAAVAVVADDDAA